MINDEARLRQLKATEILQVVSNGMQGTNGCVTTDELDEEVAAIETLVQISKW